MNCIVFLLALLKLDFVVAFDDCKYFFIFYFGEDSLEPIVDVILLWWVMGFRANYGSFFSYNFDWKTFCFYASINWSLSILSDFLRSLMAELLKYPRCFKEISENMAVWFKDWNLFSSYRYNCSVCSFFDTYILASIAFDWYPNFKPELVLF